MIQKFDCLCCLLSSFKNEEKSTSILCPNSRLAKEWVPELHRCTVQICYFGIGQNISALVDPIKKLRPLYEVQLFKTLLFC